jgi:hypothetical protein
MEGNRRHLQLRHASPPACPLTICAGGVCPPDGAVAVQNLRVAGRQASLMCSQTAALWHDTIIRTHSTRLTTRYAA